MTSITRADEIKSKTLLIPFTSWSQKLDLNTKQRIITLIPEETIYISCRKKIKFISFRVDAQN